MTSRKKIETTEDSVLTNERQHPDGRRRIKLTRQERQLMRRQQLAEAAAALFLDLESNPSYKSVSEELSISVSALKDLTKTKEFDEAYNALFAELGHDPRFRAAQAAIGDLLPRAVVELSNLLESERTPAGTKLKAIQQVFKLNGLDEPQNQGNDRQELARFLKDHEIDPTIVNVIVPPEFAQAFDDVVEGEIVEPPALDDGLQP